MNDVKDRIEDMFNELKQERDGFKNIAMHF